MNELIKIELTPTECEIFRQFRQYQDTFQIMLNHGVFSVQKGTVTINFDKNGNLGSIDINRMTYRRDDKKV